MGEDQRLAPLPYTRHTLTREDQASVRAALRSGCIAGGPRVRAFEARLAEYVERRHASAVSSGTTALEVALAALGVGRGDEVIVPTLTFVATANAVRACGAEPIFADVEAETLNLCPQSVRERLTERTAGVVAVHYAGHPADVDGLREVIGEDRFLLEDAAHGLGATSHGRAVGSLGDAACFSFHPAKLITSGEGGAVVTNDDEIDSRVRSLRDHGLVRDGARFVGLDVPRGLEADAIGPWVYEQHALGSNGRLSELGAALALSQFARIQELLDRRRAIAEAYGEALMDFPALRLPREGEGQRSAWHLYVVRLDPDHAPIGRGELYRALHACAIGVQVHYIPVHLQPYYRDRQGTSFGDFPVAEEAYLQMLSLPLFPDMGVDDTYRVVDSLRSILGGLGT